MIFIVEQLSTRHLSSLSSPSRRLGEMKERKKGRKKEKEEGRKSDTGGKMEEREREYLKHKRKEGT